ncbi:serine hydrolase domain-containing protein [Actinophytocola sp.]|uniref:serine hydrolase domain-containing protein n=1 Tax=Actinophytocola sp. TaxID=1872138 RepID=UPI002ED135AD
MTTSRRSLLGLLGVGGLMASTGWARAESASVSRDLRPGGAFDRFVAQQAAEDRFSGTVLLAHRGKPVLVRAHGLSNKDLGLPNRADTAFGLASITKVFTAIAIAQLAQQRKMAFHDTLGTHLPGFPAEIADTVTVHQLLTHTSGVGRPSFGSGAPSDPSWNSYDAVMEGTMAIIRQTPLQFTPGTRYVYSNDGFVVLGAIVAAVSGQSYFDYVRQHVFTPAGMSRTDFYSRPQVLADNRIARPYWTQRTGERADFMASPYAPFTIGPPGGAYSTVSDLLAFTRALAGGTLLSPAMAALMSSGKVPVPGDPLSQVDFYGYGHRDSIVNGQRVHGHSGSGPGMATRLDIHTDRDWVAIVLSNYDTTINPIVALERDLITA